MSEMGPHERVIGHVCLDCPTGTAEEWEEVVMETGLCKSEPEIQDYLTSLNSGCGKSKCPHGEHPGMCMDCAYPREELIRLRAEVESLRIEKNRLGVENMRMCRAFEIISNIAGDMLDPEKRAGPTL